LRQLLIRSGLETLYFSGAHSLFRRWLGGVGTIVTLHHVRPARTGAFQPNRSLEVTPEFLDCFVSTLRRQGFELISLDEMHSRLQWRAFSRRFVCITFDDAYRDNLEFAYPILKRHAAPFAIYVPTSFPDRRGHLWWLTLEAAIAASDYVDLPSECAEPRMPCRTPAQKQHAINTIHSILYAVSEDRLHQIVGELAARAGITPVTSNGTLCMSWRELARIADDPLVTIGAHTVNHLRLRNATKSVAWDEMEQSAARIKTKLGFRPKHFSYPYGDATAAGPREFAIARELGFKTAVTTRPGVLFPEHRGHLTALPRISLNGQFQRLRYATVLTSGIATALTNRFHHVSA
jgi:peptidoglycan/xylan/chitin deacetylase (PgdA/CDA1 family)